MADQDEFKDPLRVFQFMVEAETSSGGRIVGAFSEFSGINMTLETVQARSGDDIFGVQEYIPTLTRLMSLVERESMIDCIPLWPPLEPFSRRRMSPGLVSRSS